MEPNTLYLIVGLVSLVYLFIKWSSSTQKLPEGTPFEKPLPIFGNFLPLLLQKYGIFELIDRLYYKFEDKK